MLERPTLSIEESAQALDDLVERLHCRLGGAVVFTRHFARLTLELESRHELKVVDFTVPIAINPFGEVVQHLFHTRTLLLRRRRSVVSTKSKHRRLELVGRDEPVSVGVEVSEKLERSARIQGDLPADGVQQRLGPSRWFACYSVAFTFPARQPSRERACLGLRVRASTVGWSLGELPVFELEASKKLVRLQLILPVHETRGELLHF